MCLFSKIKKHNDENRNKVCDGFVSRLLYANSEADFLLQNDYLEAAQENGSHEEMIDYWFTLGNASKTVDYSSLVNVNGNLKIGILDGTDLSGTMAFLNNFFEILIMTLIFLLFLFSYFSPIHKNVY